MEKLSSIDSQFLEMLNRIIQNKMSDSEFGVSELARELGMSRSNLYLKVRKITGKQVNTLIGEARLKEALELLKKRVYTVSEVSWRAGFGSITYFNKCFHDYYGLTPGEAAKNEWKEITPVADQSPEAPAGNRKNRKRIMAGVINC